MGCPVLQAHPKAPELFHLSLPLQKAVASLGIKKKGGGNNAKRSSSLSCHIVEVFSGLLQITPLYNKMLILKRNDGCRKQEGKCSHFLATLTAARGARLLKAYACAVHTVRKSETRSWVCSSTQSPGTYKAICFLGRVQMGLRESSRKAVAGSSDIKVLLFFSPMDICFLA